MALVVTDETVIQYIVSSLEGRIETLEMAADTRELVGDEAGRDSLLNEWARARAALRLVQRGTINDG